MQKFGAYMADIMPLVQAEIIKAAGKAESVRALRSIARAERVLL